MANHLIMPVNSDLTALDAAHPPALVDPATIFSAKKLGLTLIGGDLLESSLKVQFNLAQESHP
jgi:hypothetical protein